MESQNPNRIRYLTIVSAFGQDEEEQSIIMGVDWTDKYVKQFLYLLTHALASVKMGVLASLMLGVTLGVTVLVPHQSGEGGISNAFSPSHFMQQKLG